MAKRVLMAAYHFPPSGAVAAHRAHKFARYLPDFGWQPVVIAHRPDPRQPRDESFAGRPAPEVELDPFESSRLLGILPRAWIDPVRRYLFVPDEETGWKRRLRRELRSRIATGRPDVLWANSVPTGSLVAAADVAAETGIPLVVDFHNEWTRNMYYRPSTRRHDEQHHALERRVIETARAVTTLNPLHTADLRARFPGVRCETIENGVDPEDYAVAPPSPGRRPRVFTYAGAIYGYQSPMPFLKALAATELKEVEVRIVGDRFGSFTAGSWPFPVSVRGHVAHRDLGPVFSESSAFFLCLESPASRQLPAKLYEYLRAGRPIFALAPRGGAVEAWLSATGAGVSVPVEDPGAWAAELRAFIDRIDSHQAPSWEPYHRRTQAGRLAAILDSTAGGKPR
jgi:glycosyltransferase involved in cell wall biosynthesis